MGKWRTKRGWSFGKKVPVYPETLCSQQSRNRHSRKMVTWSLERDEKRLLKTVMTDVWQPVYMWQWPSEPRMLFLNFAKKDKLWPHLCHSKYKNDSLVSGLSVIYHGMSAHHGLLFKVHTTAPNGLGNEATQSVFKDLLFAFLISIALVIRFTKRGLHPDPHAWDSQTRTAIKPSYWEARRPLSVYQLQLQTGVLRNSWNSTQLYFMNPWSPICSSFQCCTSLQLCLEQAFCLQLNAVKSSKFIPVVYWSQSSPGVYDTIKTQTDPTPIRISSLFSDNKIKEIPLYPSHNKASFGKHLCISWLHHPAAFLSPVTRTAMGLNDWKQPLWI